MKDAMATMGNLLPENVSGHDAVHVAVFSAFSDERLFPGQHVAIVKQEMENGKVSKPHAQRFFDVKVGTIGTHIGIVDPFLSMGGFPAGGRFWVYLYPRTSKISYSITDMSYCWSHP